MPIDRGRMGIMNGWHFVVAALASTLSGLVVNLVTHKLLNRTKSSTNYGKTQSYSVVTETTYNQHIHIQQPAQLIMTQPQTDNDWPYWILFVLVGVALIAMAHFVAMHIHAFVIVSVISAGIGIGLCLPVAWSLIIRSEPRKRALLVFV